MPHLGNSGLADSRNVWFLCTKSTTLSLSTCGQTIAAVKQVALSKHLETVKAKARTLLYTQGAPCSKKRVAPVMAGRTSMCTLNSLPAASAVAASGAARLCSRCSATPASN